jgi:hypothetical protein
MLKRIAALALFALMFAQSVSAQSTVTQADIEQWKKDAKTQPLESTSCRAITWLLDGERKTRPAERPKQPIGYALGWWGRGFIEGAVYMIGGEKAEKKADEFGLSVEVVTAHIATFCFDHPTKTPFDAAQGLLLKVLN